MFSLSRNLWAYRGFVMTSIKNEFIARFARSRLGGVWMIVNPLAQVLIYALILSNVLAAKLPGVEHQYAYSLYLMSGILAWSLFAEITNRCLTLFIDQGNLIKKMRFPRTALPAIVVGSSLLNNALLFAAVLAVFAVLGHLPNLQIIWLFPLALAVVLLGLGVGLILGVLNVFVRDIGQVVPILLQIAFWFTPIVYPINIVPDELKEAISYNPVYAIVRGYHDVLLYGVVPDLTNILVSLGCAMVLLIAGVFLFRRAAPEMADVL